MGTETTGKSRQTWIKDSGLFEKQWQFGNDTPEEKLKSFLDVIGDQVDYVKITPRFGHDHSEGPRAAFIRKMAVYRQYGVSPYFDHGYFRDARALGTLEKWIEDAATLGAKAMEFWNIGEPISPSRWAELVRVAHGCDLEVIYEFHPKTSFDRFAPVDLTSANDILEAAKPCLDAGASILMIDHKEMDYLGERAAEVLPAVLDALGEEKTAFEVESDKFWVHLEQFFSILGPNINVANITPHQAFSVESMRLAHSET